MKRNLGIGSDFSDENKTCTSEYKYIVTVCNTEYKYTVILLYK